MKKLYIILLAAMFLPGCRSAGIVDIRINGGENITINIYLDTKYDAGKVVDVAPEVSAPLIP